MGYTTDFIGAFQLNKPLTVAQKAYLDAFSQTRHMRRNVALLEGKPDPIREAVGLPLGFEGEFWTGHEDEGAQDANKPPSTQPDLYCQWIPSDDGTEIQWDGGEKFYGYVEWITYLIDKILKPWGFKVNGEVEWEGEDSSDRGKIVIKNNKVTTKKGKVVYR